GPAPVCLAGPSDVWDRATDRALPPLARSLPLAARSARRGHRGLRPPDLCFRPVSHRDPRPLYRPGAGISRRAVYLEAARLVGLRRLFPGHAAVTGQHVALELSARNGTVC